jgi:prepilin-type N-terminal cleavage/methylation domain-containing protein
MQSGRQTRDAGFTLIEVLVALAIVGLAMAATAGVFSNGLLGHETASDAEAALALAEERLAVAGGAPSLQPGAQKGVFADRFAWQTTISAYEDAGDGKQIDPPKDPLRLYRVAVIVAWHDGHRARELSLSTLRLGSASP